MVTVKVSDLKKMVQELEKDKIEYVDIEFHEEHEFDGDNMPASISFNAYDGHGGGIDFGDIEHLEVNAFYKNI